MIIDQLFSRAVSNGASDLHLTVGKPPVLRVHGRLLEQDDLDILTAEQLDKIIRPLLSPTQEITLQMEKELGLSITVPSGERLRINIYWERGCLGLVARVVPKVVPTPEELGLPSAVSNLSRLNEGLVLVTGPVGSGKSSTLAALINEINHTRAVNIITLEDPVEYVFEQDQSLIKQRELGIDFLSYDSALRNVLRQDVNVLMMGELRDLETIGAAVTLAETGHLIFATLHTANAAQTINRLIDVFPADQQNQIRLQLSLTLRAIISQHLVPAKSGGGRVGLFELLLNNPAIANLMRENKVAQVPTIMEMSLREGMMTMRQHAHELVKQGKVERESVVLS